MNHTLFIGIHKLFSMDCTLHTIHYLLLVLFCKLYNIHCILLTEPILFSLWTVPMHCTLYPYNANCTHILQTVTIRCTLHCTLSSYTAHCTHKLPTTNIHYTLHVHTIYYTNILFTTHLHYTFTLYPTHIHCTLQKCTAHFTYTLYTTQTSLKEHLGYSSIPSGVLSFQAESVLLGQTSEALQVYSLI